MQPGKIALVNSLAWGDLAQHKGKLCVVVSRIDVHDMVEVSNLDNSSGYSWTAAAEKK